MVSADHDSAREITPAGGDSPGGSVSTDPGAPSAGLAGAPANRGGAAGSSARDAGAPPECETGVPCGDCGTDCYSSQICVDGSCRCPPGEVSALLDLPGGPVYCQDGPCPRCEADASCGWWGCANNFDARITIEATEALAFAADCSPEEPNRDAPLHLSVAPIDSLDLETGALGERASPCPDFAVTGWAETPEGPYVLCSGCDDFHGSLHFPDGSSESISGRPLTLLRTDAEELLLATESTTYSGTTASVTLLSTTANARSVLDCPCTSASPIAADATAVYCYGNAVLRCERDGSARPLELVVTRPTRLAVADGYLYFDTLTRLRRVPVTGGESEVVADDPQDFAISPSGWVVFTRSSHEVLAVRPGDGAEPVILRSSPVTPLAVAANDTVAVVYDRDGLTAIPLPE